MHKTSFAAALLFAQIVASAAAAGDDPLRYHKAGLTTDIWRVSNAHSLLGSPISTTSRRIRAHSSPVRAS
jgi:hypothetical protein